MLRGHRDLQRHHYSTNTISTWPPRRLRTQTSTECKRKKLCIRRVKRKLVIRHQSSVIKRRILVCHRFSRLRTNHSGKVGCGRRKRLLASWVKSQTALFSSENQSSSGSLERTRVMQTKCKLSTFQKNRRAHR
jgi:hypothetical protein